MPSLCGIERPRAVTANAQGQWFYTERTARASHPSLISSPSGVTIAAALGMVLSTLFLEVAKKSLGHVGLPPEGKEGWGRFFAVLVGALVATVGIYFLLSESTILGYLLVGTGTGVTQPPGSSGDLCLGGAPVGRYTADAASSRSLRWIATHLVFGPTGGGTGALPSPPGGSLAAGQTWRFQCWYRDVGGTSNFTDVVELTFQP